MHHVCVCLCYTSCLCMSVIHHVYVCLLHIMSVYVFYTSCLMSVYVYVIHHVCQYMSALTIFKFRATSCASSLAPCIPPPPPPRSSCRSCCFSTVLSSRNRLNSAGTAHSLRFEVRQGAPHDQTPMPNATPMQ